MLCQNRMHGLAQLPDSLSVNASHLQDSARPAFGQIIQNHLLYVGWPERVQVQHTVNRKLDWSAAPLVCFVPAVHHVSLIDRS